MSWRDTKSLGGRSGWVSDLCLWSGSSIRVNRGLKTWAGVGESGTAQRLPARIIYHMWVEKNAPCVRFHLRSKLLIVFGRGIERESSKQ